MGHLSYVPLLIKFVEQKEHATSFVNGNLFCRPWVSFEGMEDKQRGDKLELAVSKLQTEIYLSDLQRKYSFFLKDGSDLFSPVFCMYHVSTRNHTSTIKLRLEDKELKEFGNFAVVINNTEEFIKRINQNLPGFSYGLIEYLDFNDLANANKFAFRKPMLKKDLNRFQHQRELRIYNTHYAITNDNLLDGPPKEIIQPNEFGAFNFFVGDLSDITEIYSIDELFLGIEVNIQNPINKKNLSKEMWWNDNNYQEV